MSSFKKADGIIDSIQKQASGLRTLDGSAIEDFLSIAGYEKSAGGGSGGDPNFVNILITYDSDTETFTPNVSFADACTAVSEGKALVININNEVVSHYFKTLLLSADEVIYLYTFMPFRSSGGGGGPVITAVGVAEYIWEESGITNGAYGTIAVTT